VTGTVLLRPGRISLADLRLIYRGAPIQLDPVARADVEAGTNALQKFRSARNDGDGSAEARSPAEPSPANDNGEVLQAGIVRLVVALKLATLAQGYAGVRWELLQRMANFLVGPGGPAIRVPSGTDRAVLTAVADLLNPGSDGPGEPRFELSPDERAALVSGTQVSAAVALSGLFEAERVFQSALISSALTIVALGLTSDFHHPRVYRLHKFPGEQEVAAALQGLVLDPARPRSSQISPEASAIGRILGKMGACLDLLRQAGATLQLAANAVSEDRLVFWQADEIVTGMEDASSIAFAADLIAFALREVGSLAEPRIAQLGEHCATATGNGSPWQPMVTSFIAENAERACWLDGDDAEHAAGYVGAPNTRRLLPMAGTTALIIAIELLAAARALKAENGRLTRAGASEAAEAGGAEPHRAGTALTAIRDLLRQSVPHSGGDNGMPAADLPAAAELVRSGALAAAASLVLPSVVPISSRLLSI
jgi:histidine ammonia-lyase